MQWNRGAVTWTHSHTGDINVQFIWKTETAKMKNKNKNESNKLLNKLISLNAPKIIPKTN